MGLNGSLITNQTSDSDSYNKSDSAMLTPLSSPLLPVVTKEKKKKLRLEEVRKSFVELVEEILLAEDVEESYNERTPDTSINLAHPHCTWLWPRRLINPRFLSVQPRRPPKPFSSPQWPETLLRRESVPESNFSRVKP